MVTRRSGSSAVGATKETPRGHVLPSPSSSTADQIHTRSPAMVERSLSRWQRGESGWPAPSTTGVDLRYKLHGPGPDCFAAHINVAMRHRNFDVARAERETKVQPDDMVKHSRRDAVPVVRSSRHWSVSADRQPRPYQRRGTVGPTSPNAMTPVRIGRHSPCAR